MRLFKLLAAPPALPALLAVGIALSGGARAADVPKPPPQPLDGPGGSRLPHSKVTKHRYGEGESEFWIYEPEAPRPESAPLIYFLHGWSATDPAIYGAWLDHLVRRGNIVIYPRYQADLRTPLQNFTPNTLQAIKAAIETLKTEPGHVQPQLDKVAVAGHSVGGILTANVAALAAESGLPPVRALISVEPGRTWNPLPTMSVPLADLSKIPPEALLLAVAGDSDTIVRETDAKRVFHESVRVPAANKNFITLVSDTHGQPPLKASHFAPVAFDPAYGNGEGFGKIGGAGPGGPLLERLKERMQERRQGENGAAPAGNAEEVAASVTAAVAGMFSVDALDYYGPWKWFDALCDAAFFGKNRDYALGATPEQKFMGVWSDGTPVKPAEVELAK